MKKVLKKRKKVMKNETVTKIIFKISIINNFKSNLNKYNK